MLLHVDVRADIQALSPAGAEFEFELNCQKGRRDSKTARAPSVCKFLRRNTLLERDLVVAGSFSSHRHLCAPAPLQVQVCAAHGPSRTRLIPNACRGLLLPFSGRVGRIPYERSTANASCLRRLA